MRRLAATGIVLGALVLAAHGTAGAGAYPPSAPSAEVDPTAISCGANVTVRGAGWQPGSSVTITLASDPVVLGSSPVAGDGTFEGTFQTPTPLDPAVHQITVDGSASDGTPTQALAALRVTACGTLGGALAFTGSHALTLLQIAIIVLVIGAALVVAVARRRRAHTFEV